ncbi:MULTISPECIES: hypothetical protein [Sulfitobacter]|uniref:DNA primase n=1 Tax=Sulfitobacter profundi TaxID=2679961 RepID=A0ABW1YTB6_9RHOB|nr:hypothetical protein [Sulfitobacter indolifex]
MTEQASNDAWLGNQDRASYRKAPNRPTKDELRDALDNAPEAPRADDSAGGGGDAPPPPGQPPEDGDRSYRGRPKGEIYDGCPVTPLGVRGDHHYFLDVLGQMRGAKKLEGQFMQSLFGHQIPKLCFNFAQWEYKGDSWVRKPGRFDAYKASMAMYEATSELGVFNPLHDVRGVGAWTDDDGRLIYHAGDAVLVRGEKKRPGKVGKHIYPAQPPIPHPDEADEAPDPVPEILKTIETWNWAVPDVHPFISLGMIATQMLCGALDWRPVFWLVAPAASGKSEFQKLIKLLHGDDGLVQTTDATKSGITSKLGQSSLPVAVDELEPGDERSTKERDIIALARVAASGGEWFRGSADQTGVGGKVYSAFLFSSILIPGVMKTQDVQRLIRLEMKPLDKGAAKLNLQPRTWRARGARLKKLLIDRWESWPDRMSAWRHALEHEGVMGRDADNWGTVLAMADMASQADIATEDVMASWAKKIAFIANADREDTVNDADAMLLHLMGQQYDPYRKGQQYNIAQWVMGAAGLPGTPEGLRHPDDEGHSSLRITQQRCNTQLASVGLRVSGTGEEAQLFIANQQLQQLKDLFRNSDWAGGVWKQSASRVPGATPTPHPLTLAGIRSRGYLMPIKSIPGLTSFPMDRERADDVVGTPVSKHDVEDWG